jgi:hypothetical protein
MPPRMFSVEGMMGLRSWRYADGTANLRAVVAASSSIADGVASALKPRRTRISPYPAAATARAIRISETAFQGFISTSLVPCDRRPPARTKGGTVRSSIRSRFERRNRYYGSWHGAPAHPARPAVGRRVIPPNNLGTRHVTCFRTKWKGFGVDVHWRSGMRHAAF